MCTPNPLSVAVLVILLIAASDSADARFLSVDPVKPNTNTGENFNRYHYANNNPYRYKDPDGRATCATADCAKSFIDATPMAKKAPPMVNGDHGLSDKEIRSQHMQMGALGPTITFQNDNPNGASPNQALSTSTARMVESAVIDAGVRTVNINSTTGGHVAPSNHVYGRATDINRVNGQRADSLSAAAAVLSIQNAAAFQPNIRENFGPAYNQRAPYLGSEPIPVTSQRLIEMHRNHIHFGGWK